MTALIVGGDHIESIRKAFSDRGMERIEHWNGRKPRDLRKSLPKSTELVVILYDSISHMMLKKINADTVGSGIPVIHCRRSLGLLCRKLDEMHFITSQAAMAGARESRCAFCTEQGTALTERM